MFSTYVGLKTGLDIAHVQALENHRRDGRVVTFAARFVCRLGREDALVAHRSALLCRSPLLVLAEWGGEN